MILLFSGYWQKAEVITSSLTISLEEFQQELNQQELELFHKLPGQFGLYFQPQCMPFPDRNQWKSNATRYKESVNLMNCVGSIDDKHIRVRSFDDLPSTNYNYENYFSQVSLACADADGLFIRIEVGTWKQL